MLFKRRRILCYVLVFDQVEIVRKSLDFLAKHADSLELVIIENPSPNTPKIKKIVEDLGRSGVVSRYYLFKENITGNAYDTVLNTELASIRKSPRVIITDGDLTVNNTNWLKEELSIMQKHPNVFACGVSLDMSNLPIQAFPSAKDWLPDDKNTHKDYIEACTGGHLLMFRGVQFALFMDWKEDNNLKFVDGVMHRYCYDELGMVWARTLKSIAYHLTWDLYSDVNHPYTKMKTGKTFQDTWYHDKSAQYTLERF